MSLNATTDIKIVQHLKLICPKQRQLEYESGHTSIWFNPITSMYFYGMILRKTLRITEQSSSHTETVINLNNLKILNFKVQKMPLDPLIMLRRPINTAMTKWKGVWLCYFNTH
jgi:hypothetical protein